MTGAFKYLSSEVDNRGQDPGSAFVEVKEAMTSIGFDTMELHWVWTLCATVLKLGNVSFGAGEEALAEQDFEPTLADIYNDDLKPIRDLQVV